ncbi:cold-shock protein [Altererythrobacter lutimaris]|uniref:Cold shock domain-containing protein n=1 Tax=Altererythrobacter lutimaris TaxID=2743979 RepID=A0A850HCV8_9SPHN|nr:cold shock domain-containing protein [Altererythrobacter lutimaris]NVE95390.1 cold shock domain-containing protein [Altererythrobacter lutimaris]
MVNYCKVRTFDRMTGTGFISPESGGELLPFQQIDVQRRPSERVCEGQRLIFEIELGVDGEKNAINLRLVQS